MNDTPYVPSPHQEQKRRRGKELYHTVVDSASARLLVMLLKSMLPEPHIGITLLEVFMHGLPERLDGLRVLHISDLHFRAGSSLALELPEIAASLPHDVVLYTGDFIDRDGDIEPVGRLLRRMPPAESYAVFGNHDHYPLGRFGKRNDISRLEGVLADCGILILNNRSQRVRRGGMTIVGVDDPATCRDNIERAIEGVPDDEATILLAHSPDIVRHLGPYRPGLVLAGHTHGGQIRVPAIGPLMTMSRLPRHLIMGLHDYEGIPVFVSRGIGYSGLDIRLWCPSEIALITVRTARRS